MSVWTELSGQPAAIELFRSAATAASHRAGSGDAPTDSAMSHAWLITGPPGSGRSNIAYAFAAALISGDPDGDAVTAAQVEARSHPDLAVLSTEGVSIKVDDVRQIVRSSAYSPSVGRYRVMVIEDADRMPERTSNVLLKALEEPPERTVWILCAPSEADLIPTIRSRVRSVRLRVPSVDDVAALLIARDDVPPPLAEQAARHAQSHIGMARRLATSREARDRRDETLVAALGIRTVTDAVMAAARLLEIAGDDAKAITAERDAEERQKALHSLGVEPGATVPAALRGQLKALEDDQKRRATRSLRDGIDRILVDLSSLFRDVLMRQLGRQDSTINVELSDGLAAAASLSTPAQTLASLDAITAARTRIEGNVAPLLALEAMLIAFRRREESVS
ncbi:DNA polymerase III subunit delta' [Glaciibacter flavus]|uniref:DNA polymerase III subunit delta n=1 Tax=Orlajensenia flava TaxID=2565934 RepID=A0A4S4FLW0_9MICO|nr:DNA polymerase III subunit delta' [Glaciibacter flavus]THG31191.1 DNA polymerase III subunit delta' [Glaciibacter flavus]